MKKKILAAFLTLLTTASMFAGCSELSKDTIIPADIINKVLSAYENPKSYYSEAILKVYENGELIEDSTIKEWSDNSEEIVKKRIETQSNVSGEMISTNDGNEILLYMKKDNKAIKMSAETGIDGNTADYKQQFLKVLSIMSKTHELIYKGKEDINGFKTIHLYASPKSKNNIIGDVNYWIDENSWFVVKSISENANNKTEMTYTKLEFSNKFDKSLFTQTIPDTVKIQDFDKESGLEERSIDMKQAGKIAGKLILTLNGDSKYTLKSVTSMASEALQHTEINQIYEKNGADAFVLTTIIYNGEEAQDNSNLKVNGEKDITIRGKKGTIMEDVIKCISWSEDGLNYSLLILNPNITIEEAKKIVENLQYYK